MSLLENRPSKHWSPGANTTSTEVMERSLDHDNGDPLEKCWCELSGCPECRGPECRCHRVTYTIDRSKF